MKVSKGIIFIIIIISVFLFCVSGILSLMQSIGMEERKKKQLQKYITFLKALDFSAHRNLISRRYVNRLFCWLPC